MRFPFALKRKPNVSMDLPEFYVRVRDYVNGVLDGALPNEPFEATLLSKHGFNSLGAALVLLGVARRFNAPGERLARFMSVGMDDPVGLLFPSLIHRATILWNADFDEAQVYALLNSGSVGDPEEICDISALFDNVESLMRMAYAVRYLQNVTVFDS